MWVCERVNLVYAVVHSHVIKRDEKYAIDSITWWYRLPVSGKYMPVEATSFNLRHGIHRKFNEHTLHSSSYEDALKKTQTSMCIYVYKLLLLPDDQHPIIQIQLKYISVHTTLTMLYTNNKFLKHNMSVYHHRCFD